MKIHRFIGDFDLSQDKAVVTGDIAEQMRSVLRLSSGDEVILCDGHGVEALCSVDYLRKGEAGLNIIGVSKPSVELERRVVLYAAVIKKENFELVAQKAVECGAAEIIPVITERTVKLGLNMERIGKIVREAAEQSGRVVVPGISEPKVFSEALSAAEGQVIVFHPGGDAFVPKKVSGGTLSVFVGPEGGFTDEEVAIAKERGADILSLGSLVLRAETAAIIASYISRYV